MKKTPKQLEIVIASYKEPLEWTDEILPKREDTKITIYRATDNPAKLGDAIVGPKKIAITYIPNGGREAGQYLYHIINRYDSLSDVTVFLQGDATKHSPRSSLESLTPAKFGEEQRPMAYLNMAKQFDKPWPHELSPVHRVIHEGPWKNNIPKGGTFSVGAHIFARKEVILANSKQHYKEYYAKRNDANFAHVLESTWHVVFGVFKDEEDY